jgi:signal transduction histidine kinase
MAPASLDRVVTNLIENGLRYGPEGQMVRVALAQDSGGLRIEVDDQGPGVAISERSRVWEPFARGGAARNGGASGVGLGLAIVRHLVESAGGSVSIDDSPTGGARFGVTLPSPSDRVTM